MDVNEVYRRATVDRIWALENLFGFIPDEWQRQVLSDMDRGETRISIRSCHGPGKTALTAVMALHFLLFRTGGTKIVVTSPSSAQLNDGLYAEAALWADKLPDFLRNRIDIIAKRIVDVEDKKNRWISFRTARLENPEAIAGIHAENVLLLIDEASGVPQPVYEAGSGTLSTEGAICMMIGNPTRTSGYFFNSHKPSSRWKKYHVSYKDSPRVSKAFVEDIRSNFGEGSAQWNIRVMGEFADQDEDVVIPREIVEAAIDRDIVTPYGVPYTWGIDPGRGGDPSALCIRQGSRITHLREFYLRDLMILSNQIYELHEDTPPPDRPESIFVDSIGLGAGVADRLRELGLPITEVNVAETAAVREKYPRLRDELWWTGRNFFDARNCTMPDTPIFREFVEELCGPLQQITTTGKNGVESKRDMKARGLKSPNLADAFLHTLAFQGAAAAGMTASKSWGKKISRGLRAIA